jgi:hypothetical protein
MIYLSGGPSHQDMYDLKMDAPVEIRGSFRPIQTNVPGIEICEHMPRLAKMMDKFAIIRSLYGFGSTCADMCQKRLSIGPKGRQDNHPSLSSSQLQGPVDQAFRRSWVDHAHGHSPFPIPAAGLWVAHGVSAGWRRLGQHAAGG